MVKETISSNATVSFGESTTTIVDTDDSVTNHTDNSSKNSGVIKYVKFENGQTLLNSSAIKNETRFRQSTNDVIEDQMNRKTIITAAAVPAVIVLLSFGGVIALCCKR